MMFELPVKQLRSRAEVGLCGLFASVKIQLEKHRLQSNLANVLMDHRAKRKAYLKLLMLT